MNKTSGFSIVFCTAFICFPRITFAIDPTVFLKILNVDITDVRGGSERFEKIHRLLGASKEIDKGDASGFVGHIEYTLQDRSQMIAFTNTECTDGYWVERSDGNKYLDQTVMKPMVNRIEVGGLSLGMDEAGVKKLFEGPVSGGWQITESKPPATLISYEYHKTVKAKDGTDFCDGIWISLVFDARGKLSKLSVDYGGC